jgi:CheY-like chemotaxis protein
MQNAPLEARQSGTILVVDDDPAMLDLARQALRLCGYHVHSARDGSEALEILGRIGVDLLVCDVLMPGLDGRALGQRLVAEGSTVPMLFISSSAQEVGSLPGAFLQKPFRLDQLTTLVQAMLAR